MSSPMIFSPFIIAVDVLPHMEFRPVIRNVLPMDPRLFREAAMGIRGEFLLKELKTRVVYDPARNLLRLNFNGLEIDSQEDIDNIRTVVEQACAAAGKPVNTVVNYNAFKVNDQLMGDYLKMGAEIIEAHYLRVARFTLNREDGARFADEFGQRRLPANLFASEEDAVKFVLG